VMRGLLAIKNPFCATLIHDLGSNRSSRSKRSNRMTQPGTT
jgi:hypothetical protein